MPQIVLSSTHTTERFIEFVAPTLVELRELLNVRNEGTSQVVAIGQANDGTWYAVLDRALQVVLTMDDVLGIEEDNQNDSTIDVELENNKLAMAA